MPEAKALLAAAGYGPNRPLKLTLLYNTSENHQKIAIAVASMWKKKPRRGSEAAEPGSGKPISTAVTPAIST